MFNRFNLAILGMALCPPLFAFPCTFTLVKDTCWKDYDVSIQVFDVMNPKPMLSVIIPKGQNWVRQATECNLSQKLNYSATFTPAIWKGQEATTYHVKRIWTLPEKIAPGDSSWEVRLCFPGDFAKVPFPPTATSQCTCDYKSIPVIPPAKLP